MVIYIQTILVGSDLSTSLITSDDDSGGGAQFRITSNA